MARVMLPSRHAHELSLVHRLFQKSNCEKPKNPRPFPTAPPRYDQLPPQHSTKCWRSLAKATKKPVSHMQSRHLQKMAPKFLNQDPSVFPLDPNPLLFSSFPKVPCYLIYQQNKLAINQPTNQPTNQRTSAPPWAAKAGCTAWQWWSAPRLCRDMPSSQTIRPCLEALVSRPTSRKSPNGLTEHRTITRIF